MKNTLLFIFFNLFLFSSIYAQKLDNTSDGQAWQDFYDDLSNVMNNSFPVSNLTINFPLKNSRSQQIPGFGINPFMGYSVPNADVNVDNFSNTDLQNAIATMGPTHLRFPFGNSGNSFNHVHRIISYTNTTLNPSPSFSDLNISYQVGNLIPTNLNPTSDEDHFITHEEGGFMTENYMTMRMNDNLYNDTAGSDYSIFLNEIAISPNLESFIINTAARHWKDGTLDNQLQWTNRQQNLLSDFIDITSENDIQPVYLLKMFDP